VTHGGFERHAAAMRFLGLTPEPAAGSVPAVATRPAPALSYSIFYGAVSFGLTSAAAYSIWAFKWMKESPVMYLAIALVYLGLGGLALSRLVVVRGAWKRFPLLFALAFLVYAIGWCAFWFGLKGRNYADLWGALVGLAGMAWLIQRAFGHSRGFLRVFLVLFLCHSAGYYLGGELYAQVRGPTGRLLWGVAHGLGFGAGLGFLLYHCQAPLRPAHR